jgi:diaminohydroxyphosphoribosylaminopyrimidine deaminase/5-amino-6-(5-phosphoribosylamino)uracil reductase
VGESESEFDLFWMRRALAEAERGRGYVEPNPLVGAVLVKAGQLIAVGHHAHFGGRHAEVEALARAGDAAHGATLYVTLEPCCHHGKTPPCTDALLSAGVTRVVAAMRDPFPEVAGGGLDRLRAAGVEVAVGLDADEARRLNAPYLKRLATGRPYVIAKWAMTLDGKIAAVSGQSAWISGPRSSALVHSLRGRMDAILVGIGTALADNPLLTARPPGPRMQARVLLDSAARLPLDSRLAATAREVPVWVAVTELSSPERRAALAARGCEILEFAGVAPDRDRVPVGALLDELGRRGVTNLLVEGGSHVLGAFFESREIDELDVFIAPIVAGGGPPVTPISGAGVARIADAVRLERQEITVVDGDVRIRGILPHGSWRAAEADPTHLDAADRPG